jgi:hypothetical protein
LEATLRETLATRRNQISDNMKRSAEKEAQAIIAQAELESRETPLQPANSQSRTYGANHEL